MTNENKALVLQMIEKLKFNKIIEGKTEKQDQIVTDLFNLIYEQAKKIKDKKLINLLITFESEYLTLNRLFQEEYFDIGVIGGKVEIDLEEGV